MAAGVAADELRDDGDECGEKDKDRAEQVPTLSPKSRRKDGARSLIGDLDLCVPQDRCPLVFLSWRVAHI